MTLDDRRDQLVLALLPHAAFDGWSGRGLAAAAADAGLDATLPARLFPAGGIDAIAHFVALADRLMAADLANRDLAGLRVPERITTAIRVRLERWAPHREAIRRAFALLALPPHLPLAARLTWGTADAIWRAAGDSSHDFSWYTRRSSLAAIYGATVLYWLDDASGDNAESLAFLARRLGDMGRLTQARGRLGAFLDTLPHPGRLAGPQGKGATRSGPFR